VNSALCSGALRLRNQASFQTLNALVQGRKAKGAGNFRVVKGLVVEMADAGSSSQELTATVHRLGAVPVALLPTQQSSGPPEWEDVTVAVYAALAPGHGTKMQEASNEVLLKSFRFQLDLLFQSYLEEVAGEFFDIEHHVSRRNSYQRLKQVEDVLATSLKTKLDVILEREKGSALYGLAQEVWEDYALAIVSAAFARVFALRFVNELYRCLGIDDKVTHYEEQFALVSRRMRARCNGEFDAFFPTGSDPDLLGRAREAFGAKDFHGLDWVIAAAGERVWLRRFVEFARFVLRVKEQNGVVGTPRLFISAQHAVGPSTAFTQSVRSYLQEREFGNGRARAEVAFVGPNDANGHPLDPVVKSQIWNSDVVISTVARDWAQGGLRNLKWIAREADHSLLLGRKPYFFLERNTDRSLVKAEFEKDFDFLSAAIPRLTEAERRELLPRSFEENANFRFDYDGNAPTIDLLDRIVSAARERHVRDLLRGYLQQFSRADRYTIVKVVGLLEGPMKKRAVVPLLASDPMSQSFFEEGQDAGNAFDRAWENSRTRFLKIEGQPIRLFEIIQGSISYRSNLRVILERLRPELAAMDIIAWHKRLLAELIPSL
jgi:hypothetical protein